MALSFAAVIAVVFPGSYFLPLAHVFAARQHAWRMSSACQRLQQAIAHGPGVE